MDILMPQEPGDSIEVCSHFDLLLGEKMAASVGRYADALYPLSMPLDDMLHRRIGELSAVE